MERIDDLDINFQYSTQLPLTVRALVTVNSDNSYTVLVNPNFSDEVIRAAAAHELNHILNGDLHQVGEACVNYMEKERHK